MVFPTVVAICKEHVVEDHCAQTQHDHLPDVANVERCIKTICLQRLPTQTILIAEGSDVFPQNIAQKPELKTLMKCIYGNHQSILVLNRSEERRVGKEERYQW